MSLDRPETTATTDGAATAGTGTPEGPTDAELARSLPGDFRSEYADVNGTRLHYVTGGTGEPLFLLPGWPETWWGYRKVMPLLARHYRVFAVDVRGMGGSDKPKDGYDKKNMALDILELARSLGYGQINIAGHDIGSMVAYSFAVNHPEATRRIALLDVTHPDESRYEMRLLKRPGTGFNMWWWAFNQVEGLPEQLLAGRAHFLIDWLYAHSLIDSSSVTELDRRVYARAYDTPDAIRATNGWYQTFHQDIADMNTYGKVTAPLLGIAGKVSYEQFKEILPTLAADVRGVVPVTAIHWLAEEQPELVSRSLVEFFG